MTDERNLYPDCVIERDGFHLTAQIAPYSLHDANGKLVVDVGEHQERGFSVVSERMTLDMSGESLRTTADVVAVLELAIETFAEGGVPSVKCVRCDATRLDVTRCNRYEEDLESDESNWNVDRATRATHHPLCDACFCKGLQAKMDAYSAEQAKEDAIEDAAQKARGCTHKIEYWIHPKAGGDDYQCVAYWNPLDSGETEPSKRTISGLLRKSRVKDDFRVVAL